MLFRFSSSLLRLNRLNWVTRPFCSVYKYTWTSKQLAVFIHLSIVTNQIKAATSHRIFNGRFSRKTFYCIVLSFFHSFWTKQLSQSDHRIHISTKTCCWYQNINSATASISYLFFSSLSLYSKRLSFHFCYNFHFHANVALIMIQIQGFQRGNLHILFIPVCIPTASLSYQCVGLHAAVCSSRCYRYMPTQVKYS